MTNKEWSEKILKKYDPSFKHRWEIYNDKINNLLDREKVWIDCGCGSNETITLYKHLAKTAIGIDITDPEDKNNFIKADLKNLPIWSDFADLITLRFVIEHFEYPERYISEFKRVLKDRGKIVILTTNLLSPLIYLPRLFLPTSIKGKILTSLFKVKDNDVFKTYHKLNTLGKFRELSKNFEIKEVIYISDLNYTRKWLFLFLLIYHKITSLKILNKFRSNFLIVLIKIWT
jgi:ubiquinone/menaquinone biosynthesis C-methylase UbiE